MVLKLFSSAVLIYFTEAMKAIALMPLVIALVPLKCSSRNLQFPHRVPFTKEKMPWCSCPFKNEAYSPDDAHQSGPKVILPSRTLGTSNTLLSSPLPCVTGAYLLHLTWSDRQVPGSPFKLNVADAAHANRVHASGAALKTIVANQTSRLVIDSREAGSGKVSTIDFYLICCLWVGAGGVWGRRLNGDQVMVATPRVSPTTL